MQKSKIKQHETQVKTNNEVKVPKVPLEQHSSMR